MLYPTDLKYSMLVERVASLAYIGSPPLARGQLLGGVCTNQKAPRLRGSWHGVSRD